MIVGIRTAAVLILSLQKAVHVDELGLLDELTAGDVLLGGLLGQESDVQRLHVLVGVVILLLVGTALLVLERGVEGAEALNLHLLRLQEHLYETAAEFLQHAIDHVGGATSGV